VHEDRTPREPVVVCHDVIDVGVLLFAEIRKLNRAWPSVVRGIRSTLCVDGAKRAIGPSPMQALPRPRDNHLDVLFLHIAHLN